MTETEIQADVPRDPADVETEQPAEKPGKTTAPGRGPLDPITKHLWRFKRPERVRLLLPFVDHQVKLERWFGRVAAMGDQTYTGTLLAVATTTIGSAADLVILKTVEGSVWAISTAQVAYLELAEPPKRTRRAAAAVSKTSGTATAPVRRGRHKKEVPDATA